MDKASKSTTSDDKNDSEVEIEVIAEKMEGSLSNLPHHREHCPGEIFLM